MLGGWQIPRLLALGFEEAAQEGDPSLGRLFLLLLAICGDDPELLQVGDVEAVRAEHGEDDGEEGEAVKEAEYDAEEGNLKIESKKSVRFLLAHKYRDPL